MSDYNFIRPKVNILKLFDSKQYLKICAPMVRYSKIQFRSLLKEYDCDLCYTPMILADSFCQSSDARNNEFGTNQIDTPLIAQVAANTVHDFVGAANLISPYCDGIDLNCGCPQKWARQQGLGCALLENPSVISDLVKQCRNQIPHPFTVSVKMRILKTNRETVELSKQFEMAGVSFLSVHARTAQQLTGQINLESLKLIKENISCPVVANGSLKTVEDCERIVEYTRVNGVMIANAILSNPTLYSNSEKTTIACVQIWLDICYNTTLTEYPPTKNQEYNCLISERPKHLTFQCFHHHLVFMLENVLPKKKRRDFNNLRTFKNVLTFLKKEFGVEAKLFDEEKYRKYSVQILDYSDRDQLYYNLKNDDSNHLSYNKSNYDPSLADGKYFKNKLVKDECEEEFSISNMFENG